MNKEQKLEHFAEREIKRNIDSLIIPGENGGYVAFGKYFLKPSEEGVAVTNWDREVHVFMNKRHAISWCVADHNNRINLAIRILSLDAKKRIVNNDVQLRRSIAERSRSENFYENINLKLQPKIDVLNMLNNELEKCINSAKYLQIKGFANETARTGRS
jgi:hypothetical protein